MDGFSIVLCLLHCGLVRACRACVRAMQVVVLTQRELVACVSLKLYSRLSASCFCLGFATRSRATSEGLRVRVLDFVYRCLVIRRPFVKVRGAVERATTAGTRTHGLRRKPCARESFGVTPARYE